VKKIFTLFILVLCSCKSDSNLQNLEPDISLGSNGKNALLKGKIMDFADAYELDSAYALLNLFEPFDTKEQALYHYLKGYILDYEGKFTISIQEYQKAIEIFNSNGLGQSLELGLTYNDLAYVYNEVSLEAEALQNYKKAYEIIWTHYKTDPGEIASIANNYLGALTGYGNKATAKQVLLETEAYIEKYLTKSQKEIDHEKFELLSIYYLGAIKTFKLNFDAKELNGYLIKMKTLFDEYKGSDKSYYLNRLIYAYDYAGYAYLEAKDFTKAKESFHQMAALASTANDQIKVESNFAALYLQSGDYLNAEKAYESTLAKQEFDKKDISYLMLKTAKAWMISKQGKHATAKKEMEALWQNLFPKNKLLHTLSIKDLNNVNSTRWMFILNANSEIFRKNFEENNSEKSSLDIAQNMAKLAAEMFQKYYEKEVFFNKELTEINNSNREEILSSLLLKEDTEPTEYLNLLENNASQHLWKNFLAKNQETLNIPEALVKSRNELLIAKINNKLTPEESIKLKEIELEIENKALGFAQNKYRPIDLKKLQSEMAERTSLLRFMYAKEHVFAVHIQKNKLEVYNIATIETVDSLAKLHYSHITSIDKSYSETALALYDLLLKRIPIDEAKSLTIVAENSLQNIPFETLSTPSGLSLGLKIPIHYSHSLHFENTPIVYKKRFSRNKLAAFAPSYDNLELDNLDNTSKEITEISKAYTGSFHTGNEATKTNFLKELDGHNIQHFAMHAILDSSDYEASKLVFSENEALRFKEIYALNIPAELVTLSACNTGIGTYRSGEGLMSLSRALVYAGTHAVVHSLWRIPDEETAEIMGYFYTNLKKGLSKDVALKLSKTQFLENNPLKQHPYFWAGFVLNGDAQALSKPIQAHWYILILLFTLGLIYISSRRGSALAAQTD
jgi:CHAT domain-containing protein